MVQEIADDEGDYHLSTMCLKSKLGGNGHWILYWPVHTVLACGELGKFCYCHQLYLQYAIPVTGTVHRTFNLVQKCLPAILRIFLFINIINCKIFVQISSAQASRTSGLNYLLVGELVVWIDRVQDIMLFFKIRR
jgi:hypothetical protein